MTMKVPAIILAGIAVGIAAYGSFNAFHRADSRPPSSASTEFASGVPGSLLVTANGYLLSPSPEEAVYLSDAGVRGQVIRVGQPRWSTPDGKPPPDFQAGRPLTRPFSIYRTATVRVTETFHGQAPREVSVALMGGTANGVTLTVADSGPQLAVGDQVVMFLNAPPQGTQLDPTNWVVVQSYLVVGSEARSDLVPTLLTDELIPRAKTESARKVAGALQPAPRP